MGKKINIWYVSSLLISITVAIPIVTVFSSFFETTGNYSLIIKNTFLYEYISNSLILLIGVLILTFVIGVVDVDPTITTRGFVAPKFCSVKSRVVDELFEPFTVT